LEGLGGRTNGNYVYAIIIGTGQAGPSLAVRLASKGLKVAIIERKRFGGTCVNNGCIPTKTLVANARVAHMARRAGEYGVMIDSSIARYEESQRAQRRCRAPLQRRLREVAEKH
jgi:pyruvate/2-oxoglutarate dehydrogenase complex dihydrolipoamide dehydrogenase (E3) component